MKIKNMNSLKEKQEDKIKRCPWANLEKHENYIHYHDNEWALASYDDKHLFEMIVLESFHCGLSWLLILNKREAFRLAFDDFDPYRIKDYSENKIEELLKDKSIVRHQGKIRATISNAASFIKVQEEFGSFSNYIWSFTKGKILYGDGTKTKDELSDRVSKDLKKRGFKFMGSVTTYSYLEAIGVMNNHSPECYKSATKQSISK